MSLVIHISFKSWCLGFGAIIFVGRHSASCVWWILCPCSVTFVLLCLTGSSAISSNHFRSLLRSRCEYRLSSNVVPNKLVGKNRQYLPSPFGGSKITKVTKICLVVHPTLASYHQPACSKTELNRCTTTEIRWNKNEDARTSPVVSTNRLPNSLENWRASLLIGLCIIIMIIIIIINAVLELMLPSQVG